MQAKTIITIVLDETGSMKKRHDEVVSGFNEFIESQKDKALGDCQVTLIKFNSEQGINTVYTEPIDEVPELKRSDYNPTGNTPLYDAVARGIKDTEECFNKVNAVLGRLIGKETEAATPMVVMLVMTDGEENSSQQYTREQVFKMVSDRKAKQWAFVFLGADMDSWEIGAKMAFADANTRNFVNAGEAYRTVSHRLRTYRTARVMAASIGDIELMKSTLTTASTNFYGDRPATGS